MRDGQYTFSMGGVPASYRILQEVYRSGGRIRMGVLSSREVI